MWLIKIRISSRTFQAHSALVYLWTRRHPVDPPDHLRRAFSLGSSPPQLKPFPLLRIVSFPAPSGQAGRWARESMGQTENLLSQPAKVVFNRVFLVKYIQSALSKLISFKQCSPYQLLARVAIGSTLAMASKTDSTLKSYLCRLPLQWLAYLFWLGLHSVLWTAGGVSKVRHHRQHDTLKNQNNNDNDNNKWQ